VFDAGALLFKIQSVGAQIFQRDMEDSDKALRKVEGSASKTAQSLNELGDAQDKVAKQSKSTKASLDEQGKAAETFAQKTARLKREHQEAAAFADKQRQASEKLGKALTVAGAATAAVVGLTVAKYTQFDQAMSQVRAATMASIDDQKRLSEAALKAGADTAYSAEEAAQAEEELAKAGLSVSSIVGGSLNGALALAAAGQLQVARSAEIMATSLTQFKLPAEQASHVADVLAAGAGKAQGGVEDMALALSYVGPVAAGLKISLEETAGAIAYMASQGILGEKAGTSLRGVIMSLTAPSKIAMETMGQYGIRIFDAQGNMKSLAAVSQILQDRLGGLTEAERSAALGRIFGNEQITAARILYQGGAKEIEEWTKAVDDSGYAAEQAAMRQDNLAGDIEKLGGAFDTALIRTGSGANDVLRDMVQVLTGLVDWYGELPAPIQGTALMLGTATAAIALFSGAALILRVKFVELRTEMSRLNMSMKGTAFAAGATGIALTGVLTIIGLLASAHAEAQARAEGYTAALEQGEGAAEKFIADQLAMKDAFLWMDRGSAIDNAKKLGISVEEVTAAVTGSSKEFEEFKQRVQDAYEERGSGVEFGIAAQQVREKVEQLRIAQQDSAKAAKEAKDAQKALGGATGDSGDAAKSAAEAYLEEAEAVEELQKQLNDLVDKIMEANGENQDAISSNAKWRAAMKGIREEVEDQKKAYKDAHGSLSGFKLSLDQSTAAGSANAAMLADAAASAQKYADDQYEVDKASMSAEDATNKYIRTLSRQREAFEKAAVKAGFNKDEVKALADQVFALPDEKQMKILVDTASAADAIERFTDRYGNLRGRITYSAGVAAGGMLVQADGGHVKFFGAGNERHEPQYARAGDWRVWAEPETGGEWYLPDSPSKRAQSLSLAAQMLDGWGYQLTPKGAEFFASGGITGRSDWSRSVRRGEAREAGLNGRAMNLVDELYSIASQATARQAAQIRKQALATEKTLLKLEKAAEKADARLDKAVSRYEDVRDTILRVADSVSNGLKRAFNVSDWVSGTRTTTTTRQVDGVDVTTQQQTNAPMTVAEIDKTARARARGIKRFTLKLEQLSKKGFHPALVLEVAGLGSVEGEPVADELLKATKTQVASLNQSYRVAEKYSNQAGRQVAGVQIDPDTKKTFDDLLAETRKERDDAKKNAQSIERKLESQVDRLIKVISSTFKSAKPKAAGGRITGPGTGTSDDVLIAASDGEILVTDQEVRGAGGPHVVDAYRAMWARGISGIPGFKDGGQVRVADYPVSTTATRQATAPQIVVAPQFHNNIVRDLEEEAWTAANIIAGAVMGGPGGGKL
jgi:TP901 family phage tail tape measure protein